ncbi:MAG: hypothetical protein KAI42_05515, partial [Dehalococcoidales bacterium]|nr:hypothetical protein [Dehalococcoidales bacterium]
MGQKVNIALIDKNKDKLSNMVLEAKSRLQDCFYADLRVTVREGQGAVAQDGMMKSSIRDYGLSYGLRVIAGKQILATGYFGQTLGAADTDNLSEIIGDGLNQAYERAIASSKTKSERKSQWQALGQSLHSTELAPIEICQDTIPGVYKINPVEVSLGEVNDLARDVSKAVTSYDPRVKLNQVGIQTSLARELFVSSDGTAIDRTYALTQGLCVVVAVGKSGAQQMHYD